MKWCYNIYWNDKKGVQLADCILIFTIENEDLYIWIGGLYTDKLSSMICYRIIMKCFNQKACVNKCLDF